MGKYIKARLMTSQENLYGYTAKIEELLTVARQSINRPLYKEHSPHEKPIGKILNADLIFDEELKCLSVVADVYITNEISEDDIGKSLKHFSSSYADGGFFVDESDGSCFPPMIVYFDAYRTNEMELYLKVREISKILNIGIECVRIRRHAIEIFSYVGGIVGAYFFGKILDDLELYEKFKGFFIDISKPSEKGKEANLTIVAPQETKQIERRLELKFQGKDQEISELLDDIQDSKFIKMEVDKFNNVYKDFQKVTYLLTKEEGIQKIQKVCTKDLGNKFDYYG